MSIVDVQTIETGKVRNDAKSLHNIERSHQTESLSDLALSGQNQPEADVVVQPKQISPIENKTVKNLAVKGQELGDK